MREGVTTDWSVSKVLAKFPKPVRSADIAAALSLHVFQVTARLKGMEMRGVATRKDGLWLSTPAGKSLAGGPEPVLAPGVAAPTRKLDVTGERPSDKGLKEVQTKGWGFYYVWQGSVSNKNSKQNASGIPVFNDHKGKSWVEAAEMEEATLIRRFENGIRPVRLRPLSGSFAERIIQRNQKAQTDADEKGMT